MKKTTLFALLILMCSSARAQDVAMEAPMPDTVVVTATRQPEDVRRTGRRVTVLTAQDLAALPVSSFDELLRTAGGVEVRSRGAFGVQSDLTVRGSGFNGVLVLIDGVPFNDPQTGHYVTDWPVPKESIARIEVLHGPATALYGPDALGGVIQVFTYAGLREADTPPASLEGTAEAQYGQHALYDAGGALRHTIGATTLSGATTWQGTNGERVVQAGTPITYDGNRPVRTDFERRAHTAALAQPLGEAATFYARLGMDRRTYNAYHFYTPFPSDRARSRNATYWGQMRVAEQQGATRWQLHAAAKQHEGHYVYRFNPEIGFEDVEEPADTSRLGQLLAQVTHRFSPRLTLTSGVSAEARSIESVSIGNHDDAAAGGSLAARWQPARRLTLNAGGRLDYDPSYGLEPTPQLSLAYNWPSVTLRANVGRAVRAPTYTERYLDTQTDKVDGNLGTPSLAPERAWSYEAGADWYPQAGVSLHITAFARRARNLIDYATIPPNDSLFVAQNIHRTTTRGLELDGAVHQNLGAGRLHLQAAYTLLDARLGDLGDDVQYKYALTSARHLMQGHAVWRVGRFSAGVQGLWKERMATTLPAQDKSYGVVHARLGYRLTLGGQRLVLSGEVRNLFDATYYDILDAPMPGRCWMVGVRLE